MGIANGRTNFESNMIAPNKIELEKNVVDSALPQFLLNWCRSRATFLISRYPLPKVPNGAKTPTSPTTPTNAPYFVAPRERAIIVKYDA
jgi:hypothetical protein